MTGTGRPTSTLNPHRKLDVRFLQYNRVTISNLSTAGQFVAANITNPAKDFICWTATETPIGDPHTPQLQEPLLPQGQSHPRCSDLIYNGDIGGYTLADGSVNSAQCSLNWHPEIRAMPCRLIYNRGMAGSAVDDNRKAKKRQDIFKC